MNLVVDVGNSFVKLAVFEEDKILSKERSTYSDFLKLFSKLKKEYSQITNVIFSSVSKFDKSKIEQQIGLLNFIILDHKTKMPFKNLYSTPKTLGVDRLGLIAAAILKYPKQNCLVIDVGTCVTYDFLNDKSEYLGGGISPGLNLRYKSLNANTANLPLIISEEVDFLIGNTTTKAIQAGVFNGYVNEISGIIQQFSNKYNSLVVILTGGDANFLSKRLKSSIFVDPNFLFKGLNYILDFNSSK